MKKFAAFLFVYLHSLWASSLEEYFSYIKQLEKDKGDFQEGEIELILDPIEISRVQKIQEERLLKKGFSPSQALEFSRVGIVNEDQYWIWLRDAVYFPKGISGTYDRLIWKAELKEKIAGVAVLPVLASGKITLNLNYRHATRSWELELPRGGIQVNESIESAALRELREETGRICSSLTLLGSVAPDTGVLSSVVPIFIGIVSKEEESQPEYSEAISDVIAFTKAELKQGFLQGFLEVDLNGKKRNILLRDSFLAFALFQAELRGLI